MAKQLSTSQFINTIRDEANKINVSESKRKQWFKTQAENYLKRGEIMLSTSIEVDKLISSGDLS